MNAKKQSSVTSRNGLYLRKRDLLSQYLPFSATTLWRKIKEGEFPEPLRLSQGIIAWRKSDVLEWINHKDSKSRYDIEKS